MGPYYQVQVGPPGPTWPSVFSGHWHCVYCGSRLEIDVFTGGQILNYEFRDMLSAGTVNAKKGALERFTKDGVVLQDGTELEADIVVFGTGLRSTTGWWTDCCKTSWPRRRTACTSIAT